MEQRALGATGPNVSVIGQGTWQIEIDPPEAVRSLRAGIDLGLTHIDTAEMYGDGKAEEVVREAVVGRRDEVFLVSKVLPDHAWFAGTIRACEASLQRLGTDHLDLYLLHWRGPHPLEETFSAMDKLQAEGKISRYGVSNFTVSDVKDALRIVGEGKIACNQVLYHLEERYIEEELLTWCQQHGIAVVAYSPFGSGRFPAEDTQGGRVLAEIATAHRVTPHQVALQFLLRHEGVFVIPKAIQQVHVADNASAGGLKLTDDDLVRLDQAFPPRRTRRRLPML